MFWQLAREKSLVPKCSGIRGNSSENSKGIFQNVQADLDFKPFSVVTGTHLLAFAEKLARCSSVNRQSPLVLLQTSVFVSLTPSARNRRALRCPYHLLTSSASLRAEDDCLGTLRITGVSQTFQVPSPGPDPHRCPWERFAPKQSFWFESEQCRRWPCPDQIVTAGASRRH